MPGFKFALVTGAVLVALVMAPAPARGEGPTVEAVARNCMGCHGEDGASPASMPTIAGKSREWLAERLYEFRSGARDSTIMGRIMGAFADEDIEAMADYFANRPPRKSEGR